jgi:hypothetical protein
MGLFCLALERASCKKDAARTRRRLAIAAVLDETSREEAAKIGGMAWIQVRVIDSLPSRLFVVTPFPDAPPTISQRLLSVSMPASNSACDDGQSGPTDDGYYHLSYEGDIVNAPQGWYQGLED